MEKNYPSTKWKFCQFCGSLDIEWRNGTHKMICAACGRSFFVNAAAAVIALIRNADGELLFTRRKNEPAAGKLDFPGGFVDLGERSEDAVIREVGEELGLTLTEISYFDSEPNRYLYDGIVYFTLDLIFVCKYNSLDGISANDDVADFVFMDVEDVNIEDLGLESVKRIVARLKKSKSGNDCPPENSPNTDSGNTDSGNTKQSTKTNI